MILISLMVLLMNWSIKFLLIMSLELLFLVCIGFFFHSNSLSSFYFNLFFILLMMMVLGSCLSLSLLCSMTRNSSMGSVNFFKL